VGLTVLNLALFEWLERSSDARVARDLRVGTVELGRAIAREQAEVGGTWARATRDALDEWPRSRLSYVVLDAEGRRLGATGEAVPTLPPDAVLVAGDSLPRDVTGKRSEAFRVAVRRTPPGPSVIGIMPLRWLHEEREALALWMALSAVPVLLLALTGGYLLSRQALKPIQALGQAVAGVSSDTLAGRLPVRDPPDEIDRLAMQFNQLLDRLEASRARNREFLRQAAHQLRTPLTLVRGESELRRGAAIDRESAAAFRRILAAAERMSRRVNDLFLLAEVESGERPLQLGRVELDALVLDVTDLFRGRAHALGRPLSLGRIEPIELEADEDLLREAVAELLENGCRHGAEARPVRVDVERAGDRAIIRVTNARGNGAEPPTRPASEADGSHGLGLRMVGWIAQAHGGTLHLGITDSVTEVSLDLPLQPPS
jgi:signal transduction histidine kinase